MKTRAAIALAALVASGLTATAATAAPKKPKIPACPTFTDPAGDAIAADLAPTGQSKDPALDIVSVTESVKGNTFSVTITLGKYGLPQYADGARYQAGFMHAGKKIELYGTNSRSKVVVDEAYALRGIRVDDTYFSGSETAVTQVEDAGKNTITLSTSLSSLSAAAGSRVNGQSVGALQSIVFGVYTQILEPWDEAAAAPSMKLAMSDCV